MKIIMSLLKKLKGALSRGAPQDAADRQPSFKESPSPRKPISEWILEYSESEDYRRLVTKLSTREGAMTSPDETAMIYALIQYLRPELCLEIGTFFAHTTKIMAEAIVDSACNTKLVTLDPFGGHRVPAIVAAWLPPIRTTIDYRSINSMEYFLDLETQGISKGAASPLGVVFVDGHHNFEYALFDIIRSADHIKPGGVIVVDNLEQEGPKRAILQFLRWNPAWKLFYAGKICGSDVDQKTVRAADAVWGALLSPQGIQIAGMGNKILKRGLQYKPLKGLQFNVSKVSHEGTIFINMVYCAVPYDFHVSGEGMVQERITHECNVSVGYAIVLAEFAKTINLTIPPTNMNLFYELELRYESAECEDAYILLDAEEGVLLV